MKALLFALMLVSIPASAERLFIARNEAGLSWYIYTESISFTKDGVYALIGTYNDADKKEDRVQYGVTFAHCVAQHGDINMHMPDGSWQVSSQWTVSGGTVADAVSVKLCNEGQPRYREYLNNKSKSKSKKH